MIPLPEGAEYQLQVREKEQHGRQERAEQYGIRYKLWQQMIQQSSECTLLHANIAIGGYGGDESSWPAIQQEMVDSMIKVEAALRPHVEVCRTELSAISAN